MSRKKLNTAIALTALILLLLALHACPVLAQPTVTLTGTTAGPFNFASTITAASAPHSNHGFVDSATFNVDPTPYLFTHLVSRSTPSLVQPATPEISVQIFAHTNTMIGDAAIPVPTSEYRSILTINQYGYTPVAFHGRRSFFIRWNFHQQGYNYAHALYGQGTTQ